jgi:hypothetical protein
MCKAAQPNLCMPLSDPRFLLYAMAQLGISTSCPCHKHTTAPCRARHALPRRRHNIQAKADKEAGPQLNLLEAPVPAEQRPCNELQALKKDGMYSWVRCCCNAFQWMCLAGDEQQQHSCSSATSTLLHLIPPLWAASLRCVVCMPLAAAGSSPPTAVWQQAANHLCHQRLDRRPYRHPDL